MKEIVKEEFERIKRYYKEGDVTMAELLADYAPILENFTIEDVFELYILSMEWANGDEFFIKREDDKLEKL